MSNTDPGTPIGRTPHDAERREEHTPMVLAEIDPSG